MTRWAVLPMMVLTLAAAPLRAEAVTLQEIIDLSRAGLGEEALLALIEIDPRVFPIDAASLQTLKKAGVSERVIIAMIKSGRAPAVMLEPEPFVEPQPDPPPPPQVVIVEREPVVREVVGTNRRADLRARDAFAQPRFQGRRRSPVSKDGGAGLLGIRREAEAGRLDAGADQVGEGRPVVDDVNVIEPQTLIPRSILALPSLSRASSLA